MAAGHEQNHPYHLVDPSIWPLCGAFAAGTMMAGFVLFMHDVQPWANIVAPIGIAAVLLTMFFWWRAVVQEATFQGHHTAIVQLGLRYGMVLFIASEVMFFAAFFGALFYARQLVIPWLGGEGTKFMTNLMLWPGFEAMWPTNGPAHAGGEFETMAATGLPAINTAILLTSSVTVTIAHHALRKGNRLVLNLGVLATVILGFTFISLQATEYMHAYAELNLKLCTGIYGSTFFVLTGFHGLHVTVGAIFLTVIWFRVLRGHFTPQNHFAFEAAAWYWHFVDVVWLCLYFFVYWL